jgi:hypothetical protein
MQQKSALIGLIVICVTILCFTWMVRDSLCEIQLNDGSAFFLAKLAYEVR